MPYTETNWKCIQDLDVKSETIKLVEENIGGKLPDRDLGNDVFWIWWQNTTKVKINKWDYIQLESFCISKETNGNSNSNEICKMK